MTPTQLYERLVPASNIDAATRSRTAAYRYGKGNIWLETGSKVPPDTLWVLGHDGQSTAIVPSLELIVVRMGMTNPQDIYDREDLLAAVIAALPQDG